MILDVVSGARVLCICNGRPDSKPGSVTPMIGLRSTILEREREKERERERENDVREGSGGGCGIVAELRLLFGMCCLFAAKQPGTQRLEEHCGTLRDRKR